MAIRAAVVGAGIAGLSCAQTLRAAGWDVEVFEAADNIGGRIGTLRVGGAAFDHGTQYLSPRHPAFHKYLTAACASGHASVWSPRHADARADHQLGGGWIVGVPGMSALLRPMAEGLRIYMRRPVHTIARKGRTWQVWFENGTSAGPFAAVVVATAPAQAMLILGQSAGEFERRLAEVHMTPCWSLLVRTDEPVLRDHDVQGDLSDVIRWVSRNSSKPRRSQESECLVVQASPAFSRATQDDEPAAVAIDLWAEVCRVTGWPADRRPIELHAHLWRYAFADRPLGETCLFSSALMVGVAGDWGRGRLAEHAFESGLSLAKQMVAAI
jgi:renalase